MASWPRVSMGRNFVLALEAVEWDDDPNSEKLNAWIQGKTGYPFIDAGMRQMATQGWMHNRARMAVASFLVKDLMINWKEGERIFSRLLIDGDLGANNGGWQWCASTGTDVGISLRTIVTRYLTDCHVLYSHNPTFAFSTPSISLKSLIQPETTYAISFRNYATSRVKLYTSHSSISRYQNSKQQVTLNLSLIMRRLERRLLRGLRSKYILIQDDAQSGGLSMAKQSWHSC